MVEKERLLADPGHFDAERYAEVEDLILRHDGYTLEARAAEVLEGLGIPTAVHRDALSHPLGRLQAARPPRPGARGRPGRPPPRRADQPPRHPLDPLAGEVPRRVQGDGGRHLARPPLPGQRLHAHRGRRLRDRHALPRQLRRLHRRQGRRARPQGGGDREAGERDRRPPGVRRPLPRQGDQGAPGAEQAEDDRAHRHRAAAAELAPLPQLQVQAGAPERPPGAGARRDRQGLRRQPGPHRRLAHRRARRPPGDHRPQRHRQVDAAQDRGRRDAGRRRPRRVGLRDLPRLLRPGPPRDAGRDEAVGRGLALGVGAGRADRLRARQPRARPLLRRRGQEERRQPLRRRGGAAHLLRASRSPAPTSWCSTSRPTTSTSKPSRRWSRGCRPTTAPWSSSPTTAGSSRSSPTASSRSPRPASRTSAAPTRSTSSASATTTSTPTPCCRRRGRAQRKARAAAKGNGGGDGLDDRARLQKQRELARRRDQVTVSVEKAEARIHEINELFCDPTFFDRTSRDRVRKLEEEQKRLSTEVNSLMGEWETLEEELAELG